MFKDALVINLIAPVLFNALVKTSEPLIIVNRDDGFVFRTKFELFLVMEITLLSSIRIFV